MSTQTVRAYIALGANLGEPLKQLDIAADSLGAHSHIERLAMSPVYQSAPHGDIAQPDYHNTVIAVNTDLSPEDLLAVMHRIEAENGRERKLRWGARTLDLDLILYGDVMQHDEALTIPHPRAHEREFVVKPLFDLDNELTIPTRGRVADLLQHLPLENLIEIRQSVNYLN